MTGEKIDVATGIPLSNQDVASNEEILVITASDSVVRKPATALATFIEALVNIDPVSFGGGDGEVATWAEGSNENQIPVAKIPDITSSKVTDLDDTIDGHLGANVVRTVGDQTVGGVKNFTGLRSNGSEVATVTDLSNQNTDPNEPAVWKFWSGTETEYQALVSSDSIESDVFYHRRQG